MRSVACWRSARARRAVTRSSKEKSLGSAREEASLPACRRAREASRPSANRADVPCCTPARSRKASAAPSSAVAADRYARSPAHAARCTALIEQWAAPSAVEATEACTAETADTLER
eukprot:scaffold20361_cov102-Isochrysis_galbana.AAC.17